ncbi:outer membrane protein [Pseudolabrys sp. FHR47]|uniref:outer membrane protein n=1 Tax=Pseudolabrys sp. FHR47 TaxID=2562284 RepID=UPI0010BE1F1F|nr:outer membrane protein [Pseudolabrys sp. FHR47]
MYARLKLFAGVAVVSLAATAAQAADYTPLPCYDAAVIASGRAPPGAVPCYTPPPVVVEEFSGWYLRGDIGITNQSVRDLNNALPVTSVTNVGLGFDASPLFGVGVGYYFNDWLRFDLTGEYRSKANFHGSQIVTSGGSTYTDEYSGSKSEWLFLLNAYVDLGTWNNITPFVGAGAGASRNTIHSFQDVCTTVSVCTGGSVAFGDTSSKWNFAWALHAGLAYKVSKNFTVELAYRYVDLGDAQSGDLYTYNGINAVYNPMEFKHLTSHDVKLGLRFNLDSFEMFSRPAPVYYAPAPVYTQPPPVYVQPPLQSRG